MYNSFPYATPPPPPPVPVYAQPTGVQRQSQISSLTSLFSAHLRVVSPNAVYDLPVQSTTANGLFTCTVRITLPPNFPETQAPTIQIIGAQPPVNHHWLDPNGYATNHPLIINWRPSNNLSQIVKEIATALVEDAGKQPRPISYANNQAGPVGSMGFVPVDDGRTNKHTPPPSSFPDLDKMSAQQLDELMSDETKLLELCMGQPTAKQLKTLAEETKSNVEALAKANLEKEKELEEGKERLRGLHSALREAEREHAELRGKLSDTAKLFEPEAVLERVKAAAEERERETEEYANQFLDGDIETSDFIRTFHQSRYAFHLAAAKAERLQARIEGRP